MAAHDAATHRHALALQELAREVLGDPGGGVGRPGVQGLDHLVDPTLGGRLLHHVGPARSAFRSDDEVCSNPGQHNRQKEKDKLQR